MHGVFMKACKHTFLVVSWPFNMFALSYACDTLGQVPNVGCRTISVVRDGVEAGRMRFGHCVLSQRATKGIELSKGRGWETQWPP